MLPPRWVVNPAASRHAAAMLLAVPLPSVPVTPITGDGQRARNSDSAEVMRAPAPRASASAG